MKPRCHHVALNLAIARGRSANFAHHVGLVCQKTSEMLREDLRMPFQTSSLPDPIHYCSSIPGCETYNFVFTLPWVQNAWTRAVDQVLYCLYDSTWLRPSFLPNHRGHAEVFCTGQLPGSKWYPTTLYFGMMDWVGRMYLNSKHVFQIYIYVLHSYVCFWHHTAIFCQNAQCFLVGSVPN